MDSELTMNPQLRTAYMLLVTYREMLSLGASTKAFALKQAEFHGMCKAIDRLGLAPTDFAVQMAVLDTIRNSPEEPPFSFASSNDDYHQWMADRCHDIINNLGWEVSA